MGLPSKRRLFDGELLYFDLRAFDAALGSSGIRFLNRLATTVGLSRNLLQHVRGGYIPPAPVREQIAKALGVDASALWKPVPGSTSEARS